MGRVKALALPWAEFPGRNFPVDQRSQTARAIHRAFIEETATDPLPSGLHLGGEISSWNDVVQRGRATELHFTLRWITEDATSHQSQFNGLNVWRDLLQRQGAWSHNVFRALNWLGWLFVFAATQREVKQSTEQ